MLFWVDNMCMLLVGTVVPQFHVLLRFEGEVDRCQSSDSHPDVVQLCIHAVEAAFAYVVSSVENPCCTVTADLEDRSCKMPVGLVQASSFDLVAMLASLTSSGDVFVGI